MPSIVVDGLGRTFDRRVAVQGLCFEVVAGEVFGLLGPNGAGKTTTVRMLTGLLQPSIGQATVCGEAIPVRGDGVALRKRVGLLTEQPGLYDRLTARENLQFFCRLNELDANAAWKRAAHYLQLFGLDGREDEAVGGFSKGMRQKLAIIRAIVHDPQIIFLDEPTSGLDPLSARTVRDAIAALAQEGRTLILCSHNLAEVERLCTRVAVIKTRLRQVASLESLKQTGLVLGVRVEADAARLAQDLTRSNRDATSASVEGHWLKIQINEEREIADLVTALVHLGARITAVEKRTRTLEDAYLELVQEEDES